MSQADALHSRLQGLSPQKRELLLRQLRQRQGAPPVRPAIRPLPRDGRSFPLSYAQRRLWFLDQLEPGGGAYNMPAAITLSGSLDEAALADALTALVRRHEVLRTTFANEGGRPVQRVSRAAPVPLPVIDLSGLRGPAAVREAAAGALAVAEVRRPFDLAAGPPLRALLLRLAPAERILILTVHHIVSDAWSMRILVRETTALYAAAAAGAVGTAGAASGEGPEAMAGRPSRMDAGGTAAPDGWPESILPPLTVQYADYAAAERQWLEAATLVPQVEYWRRRLAGLDGPLDLPADRPRPQAQTLRGAHLGVALPGPVLAPLRALAQREGVTRFTLLVAALMVLLRRYTGRGDLTIGTPIANRDRPEIEPLVGLFVNTLVLRGDLSGDPPFRRFLGDLREAVLEDFANREVPFERLVEELQPERDLGHSPLFQVAFAYQSAPVEKPAGGGLVARPLAVESGRSMFDLTLTLEETPDALAGAFEYSSDLFDADRIRRLAEHWSALLAGLAEAPELRLSQLPLLTAAERHQLLVEGPGAAARRPAPLSAAMPALVDRRLAWPGRVDERVERLAAREPRRPALTAGTACRSYGELAAGAAAVAGRLRALGLRRGEAVGMALGRSIRLVEALLGVWKAGGAYVPMDAGYPEERLLYMFADAGCRLLLADETTPPALTARAAGVIWLREEGEKDEAEEEPGERAAREAAAVAGRPLMAGPVAGDPRDLAYVLYTSGSTGRPKAVEVTHGGLANLLDSIRERPGMGAEDVQLALSSLSFDMAVLDLYLPLVAGARIDLAERETALDGERLAARLASCGATTLHATPATWSLLVEAGWQGTPGLKALCGGEALSERLAAALLARTGELWNIYGPTEITVYSTAARVEPGEPVRLGGPIADTSLVVVGANMEVLPLGVAGELWIGGAGLARGYRGRPDLTAERFVPDPFGSDAGQRMYRTGDLARFDGRGRLEYLGRVDQQVKVRGFRIEPGEVEAALESHPAVARAAVIADGAGGGRLIAFLVPRRGGAGSGEAGERGGAGDVDGAERPETGEAGASVPAPGAASPAALRAHLARTLPDHMIPTAWVELASLPVTPGGKVDRRRLAALAPGAAAGPPGRPGAFPGGRSEAGTPRRAPASPAEELVAAIWEEVLGVSDVGPDDSFFDLGGHSLLATQVVSRVRRSWGVELPLRALFELPTVARLAAHLAALKAGGEALAAPPIAAAPRQPGAGAAPLPLSFGQRRLWFLDQLEPGGSAYNVPAAVRMRGDLDAAALAASLSEVVRRHEVLRTVFALAGEEPVQMPLPAAPVRPPLVDLAALPPGRGEAVARRLLAGDAGLPFDLGAGPLLRTLLIRLTPREHLLQVVVHHIASDAWSLGLLVREVSLLYAACRRGEASPLPELPLQYADYAAWQRGWLRGAALAAQLAYWRQALAGAPPLLDLPADRPRPARQGFRGARLGRRLAPALGGALRALGRAQGATAFMIELAAFQALLGRITGQRQVVVGTPIANRGHAELEGLIGFFVNTLALAGDLGGDPVFADHLARVRETALGAYAHQDLPFEKLVEEIDPRRSLAHAPLFQVLLAARDAPAAGAAISLPGLELSPVGSELGAAKFDLTLDIDAAGAAAAVDAEIEYSTDLFDRATAVRLLLQFETLLAGALADPGVRVGDLPLLSPPERAQLLVAWNDTEAGTSLRSPLDETDTALRPPEPADPARPLAPAGRVAACLHELVEAAADRAPGERALFWRGREVTRGDLDCRANRLAHRLRALGVGPEVRVGICMERSPAMVAAMLAVLKAGGAYLPLDPAYPRERLELMVEDSGALLVLTEERLAARLGPRAPALCVDRDAERLDLLPGDRPAATTGGAASANLAYVIYTSGSTGRPKGVAIEHRSAVALVDWARGAFSPGELAAVLASTSICFDLSVFELFVPLACGGSVVLAENVLELPGLHAAGVDPVNAAAVDAVNAAGVDALNAAGVDATAAAGVELAAAAAAGVTLVNTVPSAAAELAQAAGLPPSVRTVCLAGEPLPRALVEALHAAAAARGGRLERVLNLYGPSEDTTYSTWAVVPPGLAQAPSIGRPVTGTRAYVVDRRLQPLPLGVPGELCLGGRGLARGYLGRPELTAERFVPDPFSGDPGGRLYRTGDLVRHRQDGELLFLGRLDHQVKLRGFRIELGEIEAALAAHPLISEVVVVSTKHGGAALDEQSAGDGGSAAAGAGRLVAYVVGRDGEAVGAAAAAGAVYGAAAGLAASADELRAFLAAKLPSFMVPWAFVPLASLPRNANGKLDRGALPDPGRQAWGAAPEVEEPRSEAERAVAAIWQEALGLDRVSVRDNFFDSGGHSLLAVRIHHRLRSAFGRDFPLVALFEHPTIEAIARYLGGGLETGGEAGTSRRVGQERGARRREAARRRGAPAKRVPEGADGADGADGAGDTEDGNGVVRAARGGDGDVGVDAAGDAVRIGRVDGVSPRGGTAAAGPGDLETP